MKTQEISYKNQEIQLKTHEISIKSHEKALKDTEKSLLVKESSLKEQERTLKNTEYSLSEKERTLKNTEILYRNYENELKNKEKTMKIDIISLKKQWEIELKSRLLPELNELSHAYAIEKEDLIQKFYIEQSKCKEYIEKATSETMRAEAIFKENLCLRDKITALECDIRRFDEETEEIKNRLENSIKGTLEGELREIHIRYKNEKASLQAMIDYLQEVIGDYDRRFDMIMQRLEKENDGGEAFRGWKKIFEGDVRKIEKNRQQEISELRRNYMINRKIEENIFEKEGVFKDKSNNNIK